MAMEGPPPPRIQNIFDSVPGDLLLTPYQRCYQDWVVDSGSPNFLSLDTTTDTAMTEKCRTSYTCAHSMKIQEQDTQAITWPCPIPPKNATTIALEPSSSFHSTLTPAARQAVSELFPELAESSCSYSETQRESHCEIISNTKDFTAPYQEELQLEPPVPIGLPGLGERGAVSKRAKREAPLDIPTDSSTRQPALSTIPTHELQGELPQLQLSSDLVNLGLKKVWLLQ